MVVSMTSTAADQYDYECTGSLTCEPVLDQHGRECERVNDEARAEFYRDRALVALGEVLDRLL